MVEAFDLNCFVVDYLLPAGGTVGERLFCLSLHVSGWPKTVDIPDSASKRYLTCRWRFSCTAPSPPLFFPIRNTALEEKRI